MQQAKPKFQLKQQQADQPKTKILTKKLQQQQHQNKFQQPHANNNNQTKRISKN